jgi:hypothetical protein
MPYLFNQLTYTLVFQVDIAKLRTAMTFRNETHVLLSRHGNIDSGLQCTKMEYIRTRRTWFQCFHPRSNIDVVKTFY